MARSATSVTLGFGANVIQLGQPGSTLYIVRSGRLRVLKRGPDGVDRTVGCLFAGDHFGEGALLFDRPHRATVRAASPCELLKATKADLLKTIKRHPEIKARLEAEAGLVAYRNFTRHISTELDSPSADWLQELLTALERRDLVAGERVMAHDEACGEAVLIGSGRLLARHGETDNGHGPTVLGPGDCFGVAAALAGGRPPADLTAEEDSTVFRLPGKVLQRVAAGAPVIAEALKQCEAASSGAPREGRRGRQAGVLAPGWSEDSAIPAAAASRAAEERGIWMATRRAVRRFPFIKQHDASDCGAACLAMICSHHRVPTAVAKLRDLAGVSRDGASMAGLAEAAETIGFTTRGVRTGYANLLRANLPVILHWQGNHFVVLVSLDNRKARIADPATGLRTVSRAELQSAWTNVALFLEPTDRAETRTPAGSPFRRFLPLVRPHAGVLFEVFLASVLLSLFGLASPVFTQAIVDRVLVHQDQGLLNLMLIGMGIVAAFQIATGAVRTYLIASVSARLSAAMLSGFYRHLLALPMKFFGSRRTGDLTTRFAEHAGVQSLLTGATVSAFLDLIVLFVYLGLMLYYNAHLTVVVLAFLPLSAGLTLIYTPILKSISQRAFLAKAEQTSVLIDSLKGIDAVKATAAERSVRWRWEDRYAKEIRIGLYGTRVGIAFGAAGRVIGLLGSTFILWYGARLVMSGDMTVGQLMAFNAMIGNVTGPIMGLIGLWPQVQEARIAVDRLNDVYESPVEQPRNRTMLVPHRAEGHVAFEKVFFRYGTGAHEPYVLEGIDVQIDAGTKVAVVGRSGAGKTTLVRLIPRLLDPSDGVVRFDGSDVRDLDTGWLRRQVGIVLQEPFMFSGTIAENIAPGVGEIDFGRVREVARVADADGFVSTLGMGYETKIGEQGMGLSGGQRQRLAIARALYHDPGLIILDEATNALDTDSERAIQARLDELLGDRTAFIIAHRLSTIRNADLIVVLSNGRIVESGDHDSLMARDGLYAHLRGGQMELA